MKKNIPKKKLDLKTCKMLFTGERMIPELNSGKTFYFEHMLRYFFSSQFIKDKKVLDAGCGSGYGSRILQAVGAKEVFGVDISKEAIEYAKATYGNSGVKFIIADVERLLRFEERFDTIVAFEILEHLSDQTSFLEGVKSNLNANGIFLVSTPNKYTYPEGNPFHLKELFPDEFERLLKKYFTYVYLFNQQFLFSNSLQLINKQGDLDIDFIRKKYIKENRVSINPSIKIRESRYLVAVCSDKTIRNIESYSLDAFKVDEFSLKDGIEGMSEAIRNEIKKLKESNEEITKKLKESNEEITMIKGAFNEITSSRFYRFWQFYCKYRDLLKVKIS